MFLAVRLLFFGMLVTITGSIKYPSFIVNGSCENNETKVQRMNRIINEATTASNSFINDMIDNDDIMQLYTISVTNPIEFITLLKMNDKKTLMNLASFFLKSYLKEKGILNVIVKCDMAETDARTYFNVSFSFRDETPERKIKKFLGIVKKDVNHSFTWTM